MDSYDSQPPSHPFPAPDMEFDAIDTLQFPWSQDVDPAPHQGQPEAAPATPAPTGADANSVDMARQLAGIVEDLVRRSDDLESRRGWLEDRVHSLERNAHAFEALRQTMQAEAAISAEDVAAVLTVLESLASDPNHVMILVSVAQHSTTLLAIVNAYSKLREHLV